MGVYNYYSPTILGQEWAPIREEDVLLSPAVNAVEVGHSFTTLAAYTLFEGRFYINQLPAGRAVGQVYEMAIYPKGSEDQSGPIKRVLIPVSGASITGTGVSLSNATTADEALFSPSDNKYVGFQSNGVSARMGLFFNTDNPSYAALLNGKRILGVNLIYSATGNLNQVATSLNTGEGNMYVENDLGRQVDFGPVYGGEGLNFALNKTLSVARFGEIDHFWSPTFSPYQTSDRMPHNYASLLRFSAGGGANRTRIMYRFNFAAPTTGALFVLFNYAALEVLYCEEQRYAVGARAFGYVSSFPFQYEQYVPGTNIIPLRHVLDNAATPGLAAGNWTVTIASADIGDVQRLNTGIPTSTSPYPDLNGLRQLYPIPAHPGIQINHPFPVDESIVDTVFTVESTNVLPQLSINTIAGPINEVHVYGRQAAAQVYGSVTATQEIYDVPAASGTASYPQVRFYARRFGDTTVPLTLSSPIVTGAGSTVSITPNAFDALLPEDGIIDGWKEVTLRFVTPPVMGAGTKPTWTWSATSELPGNRWEVLGAIAPALSGIPGNSLNLVPTPNQLSIATYGQPVSGAGINLAWIPGYAPNVSGTTDDPTADATLLFSQDPPAVSGLAWTMLTQPISGIGLDCAGNAPCCVPSGIRYNRLAWTGAPQYCDTFSSPAATGGWGTSSCGDVWATSGGIPSDYSVTGTEGAHRIRALGTDLHSYLGTATNVNMTFQVRVPQLSAGTGSQYAGALIRYQSPTSFIYYRLVFDAVSQIVNAQIIIPGVNSNAASTNITHSASNIYMVRAQALGPGLKMKVWLSTGTEPTDWTVEMTDSTLSMGAVGFKSGATAGITNTLPVSMFYDNFVAERVSFGFQAYELQRSDSLTDWQTIMLCTEASRSSFNDYEARVGITSSYRIRSLNVYNFASLWSPTVTGIVSSPGVTGGPCLNATGSLIFTSNYSQSGQYNLAYVQIWDNGEPEEDFVFPEADTLQIRRMFRRDYQVAFKPTERGGEAFSRMILVQAAAIAAPKLANIRSLRDMAWADLPYVCVRDEIGDRWFASVVVPGDRVLRNRRLYYASIGIVEVTATSAVIDP